MSQNTAQWRNGIELEVWLPLLGNPAFPWPVYVASVVGQSPDATLDDDYEIRPPRLLGQRSDEVLSSMLGMAEDELAELRAANVI